MQRYDNLTFMMCLPRSRSAWLSTFLKPVAWTMHDPLVACESVDELGGKIDDVMRMYPDRPMFIADTMAALFFSDISARFVNAKYLFVKRDAHDVRRSLSEAGMSSPILKHVDALRHAEMVSHARRDFSMTVDFDDLNNRLLNIWRFVGDGSMLNRDYALRMASSNIQVPADEQAQRINHNKVRRLFSTVGINYSV